MNTNSKGKLLMLLTRSVPLHPILAHHLRSNTPTLRRALWVMQMVIAIGEGGVGTHPCAFILKETNGALTILEGK